MRKRLITLAPTPIQRSPSLDLDALATVEVTAEEKDHPIESALMSAESKGWRASEAGTQVIRLIFDHPQTVKCISLSFEENETKRTQEFVLRWSSDRAGVFREIVRQQWNFSPPHVTTEVEEYRVELSGVTSLELIVTPDISGGMARASLRSLLVS
jgi:hypothetical protein